MLAIDWIVKSWCCSHFSTYFISLLHSSVCPWLNFFNSSLAVYKQFIKHFIHFAYLKKHL